jgi:hypothetical protein
MTVRLAADPVLLGPYHARAELVQDSEGGFVPCQPKLLELTYEPTPLPMPRLAQPTPLQVPLKAFAPVD